MNNEKIRNILRENDIYMWMIAKKLGVHETSFCKWFREPLSEQKQQQVLSAVEEIKLERLKHKK